MRTLYVVAFLSLLGCLPAFGQRVLTPEFVYPSSQPSGACTRPTGEARLWLNANNKIELYCCVSSTETLCQPVMLPEATEGTCSVTQRYELKAITGGAGVADYIVTCLKNSADGYDWVAVAVAS